MSLCNCPLCLTTMPGKGVAPSKRHPSPTKTKKSKKGASRRVLDPSRKEVSVYKRLRVTDWGKNFAEKRRHEADPSCPCMDCHIALHPPTGVAKGLL